MASTQWPTTAEVFAAAGQEMPPVWAYLNDLDLGVCDRVCPDHDRHCAGDAGHDEPHACVFCPGGVR